VTGRAMCTRMSVLAGMALVLLLSPAGAVASNGTVSCASGRTILREHGVRIVLVVRRTHFSHGQNSTFKTFYVCPRGARRGRKFREGSPFTREHVTDFRVFGARIGFVANIEGVQSGAGEEVGWVEVNTARSESGPIAETAGIPREQELQEEKEGVPPIPHVPDEQVNYVIAGDGTVAVASSGEALESLTTGALPPEEWEVCLLTVKRHGLSFPKQLFRTAVKAEAVILASLAISETAVTWSLVSGQAESVAR
jgi:hypothetical protein